MRRILTLIISLGLTVGVASGQALSSTPKISVDSFLSLDKLSPGTPFQVAVVVDLPEPWHIQANPAPLPESIPTVLKLESSRAVQFGAITYPKGTEETVSWADQPVGLYAGKTIIFAEGKVANSAPLGPVTLKGTLRYQACDDQVCYAPQTVPVVIETEIASQSRPAHADIFGNSPAAPPPVAKNSIDELIQSRGLFIALLIVFVGGLALNLTPCVYPMIAITVSYFGAREGRSRGQAFAGALVYCIGIVTSYTVLGVVAALTGGLFGALLQSNWVLLGVSALLVALALSMFGLFEIRPPQFLVQRAAGMSSRSGQLGVFFLGATMGIVAAPCLAPFAVALLAYVGTSRQWWWFLVFSCGLALPYLVLGTFSGLLSQLPKSGTWMVWVKRGFGTAMLAVAVWFAWPVIGPTTSAASPIAWQPYSPSTVANPGKPVLIDFAADWCIPCKEMDNRTYADQRVVDATKQFLMLRADLTHTDSPEVEQLTKDFHILGVPTTVFLDKNGREHNDLRQIGFVPADDFLKIMQEALTTSASTNTTTAPMPDLPQQLANPF
jgi:thiol:disulfide interchange protein DsbD